MKSLDSSSSTNASSLTADAAADIVNDISAYELEIVQQPIHLECVSDIHGLSFVPSPIVKLTVDGMESAKRFNVAPFLVLVAQLRSDSGLTNGSDDLSWASQGRAIVGIDGELGIFFTFPSVSISKSTVGDDPSKSFHLLFKLVNLSGHYGANEVVDENVLAEILSDPVSVSRDTINRSRKGISTELDKHFAR